MTPSSGNRTPVMPFSLQEMLSSAPHPTPLRQEPKAPCFSEPACGSRPPESDPRLGLRTDHAERVHPSSRRPAPHPPRRRLPRRLPALAQSRPGSQRGSGALWDGTRRKRRKRRQRQHLGLLPRLPRAIPEESRGSRSGEEASDEDPGVCAPVSLPRRRRWLQMQKMLVGCFLLILGQVLLLPAEAREWPPSRSISRGRHARTHPQTALLGE
ncbi:uncharacterized protein LOC112407318 [Neophocaena asiaeorientalis asiaeorientalis]|uniref:Uncharacterized protein LOC112407318 n=1 Tax=Neophocaena asiaeorientalis asiaeorientalis TaxID=1706337 RepID=A0A341CCP2_NEOAA|nr:uncharacterized protein LOC112407318 [Neophocaena asiaeorientalis asiaeorientalis]